MGYCEIIPIKDRKPFTRAALNIPWESRITAEIRKTRVRKVNIPNNYAR